MGFTDNILVSQGGHVM